MLPLTLRIIRAEHGVLAAMLRTLPQVLSGRREPDFASLRAMLFYVDEFPERLHHPKESELLFPKLRARAPELRPVLDELDRDHAQGERTIRELQHSLLAWEQMGESRREKFQHQLNHFATRYLSHMRREEEDVLPASLKLLSDADWDDLDQAFAQNQDPLTGLSGPVEADSQYAALRHRILSHLPAPLGWAPATPSGD
jgi:hemerythrin-like domain-containing protein